MTQEEPKTMNGLEALAYLNEKRGERFVATVDGSDIYRMSGHTIEFQSIINPEEWNPTTWAIGRWLEFQFTPCPDPSKPEVSEYEKDINSLAASHDFGLIPGVAVTNLFKVIEKHYVRRGDK